MAKNSSNDILDIFSSNQAAAGLLQAITPEFEYPVFILSAPRSGSSYLFEIVRRMQDVIAFKTENSPLWFRIFPYSDTFSDISDYIDPEQISDQKCASLRSLIALKLLFKTDEKPQKILYQNFLRRQKIDSYVEKTISNCFHLEALNQIFPDARYIHLVRDGRSNISSMIEAWNTFVKVGIPPLPATATVDYWSYAMPPGWQSHINRPLEEMAAWSWIEHNRYVLEHFGVSSNSHSPPKHYLQMSYEQLRDHPLDAIKKISDFTGLQLSPATTTYLDEKQPSWSTISLPKKDKWKQVNYDKINKILPMIEPMMTTLGYSLV